MPREEFARRGRRIGLVIAIGYLIFLVQPAVFELTSPVPPARRALTLAGLAAFIALHLGFWARLSYQPELGLGAIPLAAMCALATALAFLGWTWIYLFIYCAVVAAASTPARPQPLGHRPQVRAGREARRHLAGQSGGPDPRR